MNEWIHSEILDIPRIVQNNEYILVELKINIPYALETETTVFKWCLFNLTTVSFVELAYYQMEQFWELNEIILSNLAN